MSKTNSSPCWSAADDARIQTHADDIRTFQATGRDRTNIYAGRVCHCAVLLWLNQIQELARGILDRLLILSAMKPMRTENYDKWNTYQPLRLMYIWRLHLKNIGCFHTKSSHELGSMGAILGNRNQVTFENFLNVYSRQWKAGRHCLRLEEPNIDFLFTKPMRAEKSKTWTRTDLNCST